MGVTRRSFLRNTASAGFLGSIGGLDALVRAGQAHATETSLTPDMVRFTPEIEPLVRLIEDTPRDRCIEAVAERIDQGTTYLQLLAATFLAGIRNVNPQPPGFKFHCVFLAHSANYLAQSAPVEERLLPLFWVLDVFKKSQAEDERGGDFVLRENRGKLPNGTAALTEFQTAMEDWDEPRADVAVTALARTGDPRRVFDMLWAYGARDFRNIGHKAIFVANAWRTLEAIGWQHAEPTLRSLVLGLLDFGKSEVVNEYGLDDQSYPYNATLVAQHAESLPDGWDGIASDERSMNALLTLLGERQSEDACDLALGLVRNGTCKGHAIWDAIHLAAGAMMMRQPGITSIHAVTSVNALRFAYERTVDPKTKLLMLLQGVGWMGQFRSLQKRSEDSNIMIGKMEPLKIPDDADEAAESIYATASTDRDAAARMAFTYAQQHDVANLFNVGRRLVFLKSSEHHHLKWPAALFEDYRLVSPEIQPYMAATAMYYMRGMDDPDSPAVQRAIAALGKA
jgi:hypothetical protein